MFLIRTPRISSFSPLMTHTLQWVFHRKRINHGFLNLRFIFPWWLERFVIWVVQNYHFALAPPSPRGKHLAANSISELILYMSLISHLGIQRDYSEFSLCINPKTTWVTIGYQQMAVLAWVTTNVTHTPGCASHILMTSQNPSMLLMGYG